jgi:hypothetical protein
MTYYGTENVLTMVYKTLNYCICGLCPQFGIINNYKTTFRKLDLFSYAGEGRETPTLLGPLERANLNHWCRPLLT